MAGTRSTDVCLGGTDLQLLRPQRGIIGNGGSDQLIDIAISGRHFRAELVGQCTQTNYGLAGEFSQCLVVILQRVAGVDGVGARLVVLSAGFVHVGDRCQAHFQTLVGVVELLLCCRFVGLGCRQRLDPHQYLEIRRRVRVIRSLLADAKVKSAALVTSAARAG